MNKKSIILLCFFIFSQIGMLFFSLKHNNPGGLVPLISGNLAHFSCFFVTAGLLFLFFDSIHFQYDLTITFTYCVFLAFLIEVLQKVFTSYRTFSLHDIFFGVLGAFVFSGLIIAYIKVSNRHFLF
jgi:VanZ family protein